MRLNAALACQLALALLLSGCAKPGPARPENRSSNLIATAEIAEARQNGVRDLYELIERSRPRWLQIRSERSFRLETVVLVYHNTSRLGGVEVLRGYPLTAVTSIRYLDSAQAGLLPGAGSGAHVEGAIVISTEVG